VDALEVVVYLFQEQTCHAPRADAAVVGSRMEIAVRCPRGGLEEMSCNSGLRLDTPYRVRTNAMPTCLLPRLKWQHRCPDFHFASAGRLVEQVLGDARTVPSSFSLGRLSSSES